MFKKVRCLTHPTQARQRACGLAGPGSAEAASRRRADLFEQPLTSGILGYWKVVGNLKNFGIIQQILLMILQLHVAIASSKRGVRSRGKIAPAALQNSRV